MNREVYQRLGLGLFIIIAIIGALPLHRAVIVQNEADPTTTVPVFGTTTVSQTFTVPTRLLVSADFAVVPNPTLDAAIPIQFTLTDAATGKSIRQQVTTLAAATTEAGAIHFEFKPALISPNKLYRATVAVPQATKNTALLLPFQIADELYPDGNYFMKDRPRPGDLGFRVGTLLPLATTWPPYFALSSKVWDVLLIVILLITTRSILRAEPTSSRMPVSRSFMLRLLIFAALSAIVFWLAVFFGASGAPYDTAHNGLEAMEEVLMGNIQPFYEHYTGHQPLTDWILAGLFLLIGLNTWTLHSAGIAAGVATVVLLVVVGRQLWGERAGWYAGLFGLTSHWLIVTAQDGMQAVLLPPLILIWLLGILKVKHGPAGMRGLLWAIIAGGGLGLLGYVYAAGWLLLPPLTLFLVVWCIGAAVKKQRTLAAALLVTMIVAALILLPLVRYTIDAPERIFEHPKQITDAATTWQFLTHAARHIPSTIRGLTWLPVGSTATWEDNGLLTVGPLSMPFPIPLINPIGGLLLIGATAWTLWRLVHRQAANSVGWLLTLAVVAVVPALIATGSQPSPRRSIDALPPLLLILAFAADRLHRRLSWAAAIVFALTFLWGPIIYFGYAVNSQWFQTYYLRDLDILARPVFARIAAGQNVAVIGNWAHLKSFQFYALATPAGKAAFTLLHPNPERWPALDTFDTVVVAQPNCQQRAFAGFTAAPIVVAGKLGTVGCIFDKAGASAPTLHAGNGLPSSGPLLKEWWAGTGRFREHRPFRGPIFGRL